jgi:hypothetical protein
MVLVAARRIPPHCARVVLPLVAPIDTHPPPDCRLTAGEVIFLRNVSLGWRQM